MLGLKRIVLHNSYFTGLSVMFDADGHSNASGGNGAGKTSALNLIPIFYGTEPNQLVDQVADKDSFLDFYLPKQSSALIYEHQREDGFRLVVMYRHSTGAKIIYRFVNGSLEDTFLHPDISALMKQGVSATDIFIALNSIGVKYSRQIDTITDYRALIQNDRRLLRRKGVRNNNDLALAREYCLGGPNDHMSHLDKMSYAILRRADMFNRLKTMIAETQFNEIHIDDRPEHLKDKTLIEDIAGVRDFDSAEASIRECIDKHHQRQLVIADRNKTAAFLKSACLTALDTVKSLSMKCEETRTRLKEMSKEYTTESQRLRGIQLQLEAEVNQINNEIEAIHVEHQKWLDWNVSERQAAYSNLKHHLARLDQLESDLKMLTGKVENLEQQRDQAKIKAQQDLDKAINQCNQKKLDLSTKKTETVQEYADHKERLEREKHDKLIALQDGPAAVELRVLNEQLIQAKEQARTARISEEDQAALDDIDLKIDALNDDLERGQSKHEQAESNFGVAEANHKKAVETHNEALEEIRRLQAMFDDVQALAFPENGTLLSQLRQHDPQWAQTVGKVIEPELLRRTDLNPDFAGASESSFFGWVLDLHRIQTPDHASNEDALLARLEEAETRLSAARSVAEEREAEAINLKKELIPLQAYLAETQHRLRQLNNDSRSLRERQRQAKSDAMARAKAVQAEQNERVDVLTSDVKEAQQSLDKMKSDIADNFDNARLEVHAREQSALSDIEAQYDQLSDDIRNAESDHKVRLSNIEQRFSEECEREGVDPEKIRAARTAFENHKAYVDNVQGYMTRLKEYEHWVTTYWSQIPSKETLLSETRGKASNALADVRAHNKQYSADKSSIEKQLRKDESELGTLNDQTDQANQLLSRCPAVEATETEHAALVDLISTVARLLEEEGKHREKVLAGVSKAQIILNKYTNSRIYKAWESLLDQRRQISQSDEHSDSFRLKQPEDLKHLLDEDLPAIRDILIQQVRAVGDSLSKYHDCLKGLNDEVARVSRHLDSRVNTNQRIEDLSNIEFQITSVVVEGDYWDKLSGFNQLWKEWQEGRDLQLPPDELLYSIQIANEALQAARIKNDINSLIRLKISLEENGRKAYVTNAKEFDALSSNGLSYLAILVIFMGMARYLCPNNRIALNWPIDELAALSPENVARLFHMFEESGIYCFSAFPSADPNLLKFFKHKKLINRRKGVQTFSGKDRSNAAGLRQKLAEAQMEGV